MSEGAVTSLSFYWCISPLLLSSAAGSANSAPGPRGRDVLSGVREGKEQGRGAESEVFGDLPPIEFPRSLADSEEG